MIVKSVHFFPFGMSAKRTFKLFWLMSKVSNVLFFIVEGSTLSDTPSTKCCTVVTSGDPSDVHIKFHTSLSMEFSLISINGIPSEKF